MEEPDDKPASLYERLAAAEDAQVLVFGHTHKPWVHTDGGVLFVNCGSVGKPKDGDPRAAFAILGVRCQMDDPSDRTISGRCSKPLVHSKTQFLLFGSLAKNTSLLELDDNAQVRASIERVPYDAEAVAREVAAAGLPGEYAAKLVAAA